MPGALVLRVGGCEGARVLDAWVIRVPRFDSVGEGFVRFTTPEIVRYLRMARGELGEVQSNLEVGRRTKYFSTAESGRAETLARRAMGTTTSLLKSKLRQLEAEARAKQKKSLKP